MILTGLNRTLYPTEAENINTFFSRTCRAFCRIDHILWYTASLNKLRMIEIIANIFFLTTIV